MNLLLQTLENSNRTTSSLWNSSESKSPALGFHRPDNFHPLEISALRLPLIGKLHIAATLTHIAADFFHSAFPASPNRKSQIANSKFRSAP